MTVKTKLKLDDWFKSYGPMKYPFGSPLGAAILCIIITQHSPYVQINLWFLFGCM